MSFKANRSSSGKRRSTDSRAPHNAPATLMKWVGGVTAILSLVFASQQFLQLTAEVRERSHQVAEQLVIGNDQQNAGDYESAWISIEQAAKDADAGGLLAKLFGSLSDEQHKSREAQENLAMRWLENIHIPEGKTFSDVVDKLVPVLTRGAASASGVRKADLLAHLGWAYFLKTSDESSCLDGPARLHIERYYKEALEIDIGNPYAHVHWGHLIIWARQNPKEALEHFSAAIASGRARPYVRTVQLAALYHFHDMDGEFLRAVNDMVKNNEKVDEHTRSDILSMYYLASHSNKDFQQLTAAVPASDQIAIIRTLFYDEDFEPSQIPLREAALAMFQEAAGLREDALKTWRSMRSIVDTGSTLAIRADASIKRLSQN